jgi:hypothetical protein
MAGQARGRAAELRVPVGLRRDRGRTPEVPSLCICCWLTIRRTVATATVRLLRDAACRVRLTETAEALYLERYEGRVAEEGVRRLVEDVAASTRS